MYVRRHDVKILIKFFEKYWMFSGIFVKKMYNVVQSATVIMYKRSRDHCRWLTVDLSVDGLGVIGRGACGRG